MLASRGPSTSQGLSSVSCYMMRSLRTQQRQSFSTTFPKNPWTLKTGISFPFSLQRNHQGAATVQRFSTTPTTRSTNEFHLNKNTPTSDNAALKSSLNIDQQEQDTIFALSSGSGNSNSATALAVIRISGPLAESTLQSMLHPKRSFPKARQATLCKLYHPIHNNSHNNNNNNSSSHSISQQPSAVLDHALVLYFPQPHSFTGESVVELHCHGSRAVVTDLLEALGQLQQHRLAEPGEFTQRAFAAGKLDLMQVEALADLLTADTSRQRQQALVQLEGTLSQQYDIWRAMLIKGLAHAEAVIDFGDDEALGDDYDDETGDDSVVMREDTQQWDIWGNVRAQMNDLCQQMEYHLRDSRRGELVREGLKIAIVGPPNAGKSSLFNVLAQKDAAIVSNIAGTTRDVLELSLNLGGIKCVLSDTAGVRSTSQDVIEQEGIKRAKLVAQKADVVVAMVEIGDVDQGLEILQTVLLESSKEHDEQKDDNEITAVQRERLDPDNVLLVLNKLDLKEDNSTNAKAGRSPGGLIAGTRTFEISCHTNEGIDSLLEALTQTVNSRLNSDNNQDSTKAGSEGSLITRARHRQHVQAAVQALRRFDRLSQQGPMVVDMAAEELRLAASELGRITGAVDVEDILDVLFKDFCIGK